MFTGKAKDKFENYIHSYYTHDGIEGLNEWWSGFPMSMKWGVIQDFGEANDYTINVYFESLNKYSYRIYRLSPLQNTYSQPYDEVNKTRQEACTAAIEKLNELINKL